MGKKELIEQMENFEDPRNRCFLCARSLDLHGQTSEHIVPQWAQRRYDLWNQQIILLNMTSLPYRQLTVPCCDECNKYRLKPIEDSINQCVDNGRNAVLALGPKVLYLWLGKIFYGILYRELMLLVDRTNPAAGSIITEDFIRRYKMHRYFLQQARELVELKDFQPGSIFVFNAQHLPHPRLEWDLADNVDTLFLFVRVGRVAIYAALGDGGAQQFDEGIYSDIYPIDLHPLQIRELCSLFVYRSMCATRTPKYISTPGTPDRTWQMPLGGLSLKPLFEGFDVKTYAQVLSFYTGYPLDILFQSPDRIISWLRDNEGRPRHMPFKDFPTMPLNPSI